MTSAPPRPEAATMRALQLRLVDPRAALALVAGRVRGDLHRGGLGSPLRLAACERPARPPGWVRIRPLLAGVCASDRKFLEITGWGRTLLYGGVPRAIIPGHEIVGTVVESDPGSGLVEGTRVVAEPILACLDKGLEPCPACTRGDDNVCARRSLAGSLDPGQGFGHNARYGGGWGEEVVAPARRVVTVPDSLDDRSAVLAEPSAIGVHAVSRHLPRVDGRALVIGPGAVGLAVVHALRALAPDVDVTVAGLGHYADDLALGAGADSLLHGRRGELVDAAGALLGTGIRGGRLSGHVLEHGFDVVYDAVGSEQTIDDGLRMSAPGGTLVLIGTSIEQKMDWSLVWWREITVCGTVYYGDETVTDRSVLEPGTRRATEIALEILQRARPAHLVTHVFTLDESVEALRTAEAGPAADALKVAFAPQE